MQITVPPQVRGLAGHHGTELRPFSSIIYIANSELYFFYVCAGEGKTVDYTEVLRGIHFVHSRPEDINMRIFRVTCTDLKTHIASNQLTVQVNKNK